jgi:hypothetical protein
MTNCPLCDLTYAETFGPDVRQHKSHCKKVAALKEKYGDLWGYRARETSKGEGWDLVRDESLPLNERVKGAEQVLWAWFSRSVLANMSAKHPKFPEYAAMILNQQYSRKTFPEAVRAALVGRYGQRPGIREGKSYWQP